MDPNETLRQLRQALAECEEAECSEDWAVRAPALAEAARALDEWLSRGGFLPDEWDSKR